MTHKNEIYKCEICGNVVEVISSGPGELVCCEQPMTLLNEKSEEEGITEKHKPVATIEGNKVIIHVGSVDHPMEEAHYIQQIEVIQNNDVIASKQLSPGEKPHAEFIIENPEGLIVRSLCNIHGLWKD